MKPQMRVSTFFPNFWLPTICMKLRDSRTFTINAVNYDRKWSNGSFSLAKVEHHVVIQNSEAFGLSLKFRSFMLNLSKAFFRLQAPASVVISMWSLVKVKHSRTFSAKSQHFLSGNFFLHQSKNFQFNHNNSTPTVEDSRCVKLISQSNKSPV